MIVGAFGAALYIVHQFEVMLEDLGRSVHLETHPVVDFIVCEGDMILIDCIPTRKTTALDILGGRIHGTHHFLS